MLSNAGQVSHEGAKQLVYEEYARFRVTQDMAFVSDFEREVKGLKDGA